MAVFLKIGNYLVNPNSINFAELKRDTDEVIIYFNSGQIISLDKLAFKKIFDAFNSEGLITDKTE